MGVRELTNTPDLGLHVFPNPATDVVYLTLNLKEEQNVTITVSDILGKVFFTENMGVLAAGNHKMSNNIRDLSSGTYFVTVQTEKETITKKFVK